MTGLNSSPIANQNQVGLKWSLGTVTIFNTSTPAPNIFTIDSSTGVLSRGGSQSMADLTSYSVPVNLTDCDGNGLSSITCNLVVSVGAQRVPKTICGNRQGNIKAATCVVKIVNGCLLKQIIIQLKQGDFLTQQALHILQTLFIT